MEQKNRFLSLGIALGLIAGTAAGVLVDLFTGSDLLHLHWRRPGHARGHCPRRPARPAAPCLLTQVFSAGQQARKFL